MNNNYCPIPGASQQKEQSKTIVERIGEPAFLEQLAEECSELSQAALKLARKMRDENPTPKTYKECIDSLQEEMADVLLCIDEYMNEQESDFVVWTYEIKKRKLKRWKQRLEEAGAYSIGVSVGRAAAGYEDDDREPVIYMEHAHGGE